MANDAPVLLPVDYKGTSPTNRIRGEKHILNKTDAQDHRVIIPDAAPFYANQTDTDIRLKLNITNPQTGEKMDLIEGVHYYPVFYFIQASKATMYPVYGGVEFLDYNLEGTVEFEFYQALGGIWTLAPSKIAEILADMKYNPRSMSWDQIADLPERFPVVDHEYNYVDMVGQKDVIKGIYAIRDVLVSGSSTGLQAHIDNRNNPHVVTKEQVNLGLVMNYAMATITQARVGLISNAYMSPSTTKEAIAEQALKPLAAHIALPNPHGLTPAILGSPTLAEHDMKLDKTGTAANSTRFAGYSFPEAAVEILKGTAFNSDRIGGLTLEQIRAETSAGTIENAQRLQGHTLAEVLGLIPQYVQDNYTAVAQAANADQLEGMSLDEVLDEAARQTGDNALKFDGRTPEQFQQEIYANLGNNLSEATTANFNDVGLTSLQRLYFNDNRYFPIYRFNIQELSEWSFPPGLKANVNHSMLVSPMDYNGVEIGPYVLSINTLLDLTPGLPDPTQKITLTSCSIRPLFDTDVVLFAYVRKIGNDVGEIVIDRRAELEDGTEVLLSAITIGNISALSKFIARKDVFENESEVSINLSFYLRIPQISNTVRVPDPITITMNSGDFGTLAEVTVSNIIQVYGRETGDTGPFYPVEHLVKVEQTEAGTTLTNNHTADLELFVKYR